MEHAVEAAEEPAEQPIDQALHPVALGAVRQQQPRGQRRAERERVERRDDRRDGNRQRELPVELSRQAADEGRRHEDRAQHQGDGDDRARHFFHRLPRGIHRRLPQLDVPLHVLHDHNRIVHHDAYREDEAEERQRVEREAEAEHHREGADERDRHRDQRDDRGAPRLEEHDDDDHDEENRFQERVRHRVDRLADEHRRVVHDAVVHARREVLLESLHRRVHVGRGLQRVGARALEDANRHRRLVVEQAAQRVAARAELQARDVRQPRDLPVGSGPDHDVAELGFGAEPASRVDRELERRVRRRGRRAEHACRHLDVLLADGPDDVAGGELPRREAIRIEPHAHAVLAGAEDLNRAHTGQPADLVFHLQVRVVRQVEHVVALVRRHQVHHHDEVRRRLFGGHADALHVLREPRQRLRHAVLDLDLRVVEIGAEREGDRQRQGAVGGGLREHVEHALDAVHLLLERRRHGFGDHLRVRARKRRADDDRGRHDARVLADRQPEQRQQPGDDDEHRQDDGEDGPRDEEGRELHSAPPISTTLALTGIPGLTRCRPFTTTSSPSFSPCRTTRRPSTSGPRVTVRDSIFLSAPTTRT